MVCSLHFVVSKYYTFLQRCKFQACPSHLLRNFSGIFGRMGVHVCVWRSWEREGSSGNKESLRVLCAWNLGLRNDYNSKPALRFLGLFAVDLLIRKHPWWPKVRYHEYGRETRANFRSFSRQLTLETELVVASAMMIFWMALLARGRVIFVPGAPAICWVESRETRGVAFEEKFYFCFLYLFFAISLLAVRISLLFYF